MGADPAVIAELVTSALIYLGLAILISAAIIHWSKGSWVKTSAVVYTAGAHTGLRWHNQRNEIREVYVNEDELDSSVPGTELTVFYQPRKPSNWSVKKPHGHTLVLAAVGAGMAIIGTIGSFLDFFAPPS